jgi:hypothetical protein
MDTFHYVFGQFDRCHGRTDRGGIERTAPFRETGTGNDGIAPGGIGTGRAVGLSTATKLRVTPADVH